MTVGGGLYAAMSSIAAQLVYPVVFPTRRLRLLALLLSTTLVFMLFYFGSKPLSSGLLTHPWDKAVHYLFFGGLTGMFWVLWGGTRRADLMALVMTLGVGIADEWTQAYNPARSSSLADLSFDLLGALTAVLVLNQLRQRTNKDKRYATTLTLPPQTS